jgi:hypothetical protein
MAIYQITAANSVETDAFEDHAFDSGTPVADTLIIDAGAYLKANDTRGYGAILDNTYAWTVRINGLVHSETAPGIYLVEDNAEVSTITIGKDGVVYGVFGIYNKSPTNITNAGRITGAINAIEAENAGAHTIKNTGTITGRDYSILTGASTDAVTNSGKLDGDVSLNGGSDRLTNSGLIIGSLFGGEGNDAVKNSGSITGTVDLGGGDDSFTGGNRTEIVVDGAASDTVKLGGGDDFYFSIGNFNQAEDGVDVIDGGAGFDSINAASATDSVYINLDNKAHDFTPFLPGAGLIAGNTATGIGLSVDSIRNFEHVVCGSGSDIVYGNATGNLLVGGGGYDTLAGFGGNDVLIGGDSGDALWGGIGRDYLTGGEGVDYFQFAAIAESKLTATTRDAIMDFESGIDRIDLRPIDANTKAGKADDAFSFIGAANFSKTPGELRIWAPAGMQIVEGDVNGDGKADFSVEVVTTQATYQLTAADFLL